MAIGVILHPHVFNVGCKIWLHFISGYTGFILPTHSLLVMKSVSIEGDSVQGIHFDFQL